MLSKMVPGILFALVCSLMSGYFMILFIFSQILISVVALLFLITFFGLVLFLKAVVIHKAKV